MILCQSMSNLRSSQHLIYGPQATNVLDIKQLCENLTLCYLKDIIDDVLKLEKNLKSSLPAAFHCLANKWHFHTHNHFMMIKKGNYTISH